MLKYSLPLKNLLSIQQQLSASGPQISQIVKNQFSNQNQREAPIIIEHLNEYFIKINLNRPKQLNALNLEMVRILQPFINQYKFKDEVKIFWFQGVGKSFCAGGDIRGLYDGKMCSEPEKQHVLEHFCREEYTLAYTLATMKSIQISIFDGFVMGGGVGISAHSAIKIATENSVYAMPECKIGFFTDVGGGFVLARLKKNIGLYLGVTSGSLRGEELVQAGAADYFIKSNRIQELQKTIEKNVKKTTTLDDLRIIVKQFASELSRKTYQNEDLINKVFGAESFSQMIQNLKNCEDEAVSKKILDLIFKQNAISVRVSYELIKRAQQLSLKEDLILEYRITKRFFDGNDFYEGVRTLLIDKNDQPKWTYKNPQDVPESLIFQCFDPLPKHIQELNI